MIYLKKLWNKSQEENEFEILYGKEEKKQKCKIFLFFSTTSFFMFTLLLIFKLLTGQKELQSYLHHVLGIGISLTHFALHLFAREFIKNNISIVVSLFYQGVSMILVDKTKKNIEDGAIYGILICGILVNLCFFYLTILRLDWKVNMINCLLFNFFFVFRVNYELRNVIGLHIEINLIILVLFLTAIYLMNGLKRNSISDFEKIQKSKKYLLWHKMLIEDHIPCQIIVMNLNLDKILFKNKAIDNLFKMGSSEELIEELKKIEIHARSKSDDKNVSLCSLFEYLSGHTEENQTYFKCVQGLINVCHEPNESPRNGIRKKRLDIKLGTIDDMFGEDKAWIILFNDLSLIDKISELKNDQEQKDLMLATVSHDLRTPINSIIGILSIVQESLSEEHKKLKKYVSLSINSANSLLLLVNDLLDVAQIKKGKLKALALEREQISSSIEPIFQLLKFSAKKKGVNLQLNLNDLGHFNVLIDKNRFHQVMMNLVGNALKFTDKGGFVKIDLSRSDLIRNSYRIISVEDNGLGIKQENISKLFSEFGKLENNRNKVGIGLGLLISQKLAKLMVPELPQDLGGIQVKSEFGKGSQFYFPIRIIEEFTLNFIDDIDEGDLMVEKSVRERNLHPLFNSFDNIKMGLPRILLVDDDQINLLVLKKMIQKIGSYPFETAFNGRNAIQLIDEMQERGQFFDMIFMDKNMPDGDGMETAKIIHKKILQKKHPLIPIYILTADNFLDDSEIICYRGVTRVLKKPLSLEDLSCIIKGNPFKAYN